MADGFLGRWSRRKLDPAREELPPETKPVDVAGRTATLSPAGAPAHAAPVADDAPAEPIASAKPPPPTLEDAQALTPESDFTRFAARDVAPEVRNAAMKKLFADPHFNVMDRMDVYIDDYSQPDPLPESMLRQLASAKFLGFFADEEKDEDAADAAASSPVAPPIPEQTAGPWEDAGEEADRSVAESQGAAAHEPAAPSVSSSSDPLPSPPRSDADPDLRLQPNDAARADGDRRGAG